MSENDKKTISIKDIINEIAVKKINLSIDDIQQIFQYVISGIYTKLLEYDEVELGEISEEFSSIKRIPSIEDLKNIPNKDMIYYDKKEENEDTFKVTFVRHIKEKENNG